MTRPIFSTDPQTQRASHREEPSFFSSTRKTIGVAGAIFFALGAVVMDPVLLIPAAICAAIAFEVNCLNLFSAICSALTSSREATRNFPSGTTVILPSTTVYAGNGVSVQAMPTSTTVHTTRGGGYAAVPSVLQGYQPHIGLNDVGLRRGPTPQPSPQQGTFTSSSHHSTRTVQQASSLAAPRVQRGQGSTGVPEQRDEDGVALPPRVHVARGGGFTVEHRT